MPVYRITAPDGQSYEVTAPEGATEQDVLSYAQANYSSASAAPEPEQDSAWDFSGERTIFGRGQEMLKAVPRNALSYLGTIAEGVEGLTDYLPARKVADYATEKFADLVGMRDRYERNKEWVAKAPEQFTRYINEDSVLKADEKYKDLWTTALGEGAGSMLTMAAASLINPGLGWATMAAGGAGDQQQRMRAAEEAGEDISEFERARSTVFGGLIGLTEGYTLGKILKPLNSIPKNIPIADKSKIVGMMSRAMSSEAVKTGLEEGTQEVISSVLQSLVEMGYNPNAELPTAESMWTDFSTGAFLGTGARMLTDAASGHRNTVMGKMELERERKAREREEANFALAGQQLRADAERRAAIETDPTVFAQEAAARQREAVNVPPPTEDEVKTFNSPSVTGAAFTPSSFGELYAYRIIGNLGKFFPTNTTFDVVQKDNGFAVVDANGNQYGQDIPDQRAAKAVAINLNREVPESGIRSAILDTLKSSPQAVSEQDFEPLYRYGYRALSPETGRVTFASLNEAAGTTADKGYIEDLPLDIAATAKKVRENRYSIQMPDGSTQYITGLTAAQKLNLKRVEEGLPEATSFGIGEARDFLGGTVGKLAEPVVSGIQDRLQYGASLLNGKPVVFSEAGEVIPGRKTTDAEKLRAGMDEDGNSVLPDYIEFKTLDEAKRYAGRLNQRAPTSRYLPPEILADKTDLTNDIKRLLDAKNITSEVSSPEIGQLVKAFTGAKSFSDMTLDDQKLFYARMRELPKLSKPAKIPVFKARTYTPEQFVRAAQAQNQSGKMLSDTEIAQAAGLEPDAKGVTDIRRELKRQNGKRFVELRRMAEEVAPVQEALGKILSEYGIDPNILKVSTRLKDEQGRDITDQTEGFYDPRTKELALAIDSIDPEGKLTQEQRVNALAEVMSHEIIHALRAMDMFTQKEWALLEAAATRTQKPGKGMTYLQWARRPVDKGGYADKSATVQVEEAIADMARDLIGNKKVIGGKPRNLLERIIQFFTKVRNLMDGYGFTTFEDLLNAIRSGEVGRREQGVVRSLRTTEAIEEEMGYLPARYRDRIAEFGKAPPSAPTARPAAGQTAADFDVSQLVGAEVRESRKDVKSSKDWAYSPLMKAVESVSPKVTTAKQWEQWLDANASKLGVTKDEIEFSGIKDFIALKEGKVSKDDVLAYLDQNGVQVTEKILGESVRFELTPEEEAEFDELLYRYRQDPDRVTYAELDRLQELEDKANDSVRTPTKYQNHTISGGKDYRELLLTLPSKNPPVMAYQVIGAFPREGFKTREDAQKYIDDFMSRVDASQDPDVKAMVKAQLDKFPFSIYEYQTQESLSKLYRSGHWDEPNVVAHTRIDTRTDANGEPVLFVNEIQSDWGQEGRKKGFNKVESARRAAKAERKRGFWEVTDQDGNFITNIMDYAIPDADEAKAIEVANARLQAQEIGKVAKYNRPPTAPFVTDTKSWVALTIKRLLRYAVDNGFKKVALINGEQAADIFDLSNQIDYIEYEQTEPGKYYIRATDHRGGRPLTEYQQTPEQLEGLVGKEIAQKIVDGVGEKGEDGNKVLRTKDLKVGGEGMKSFYDRIVPQVATDVIRKIGGKNLSYSYIGERSNWTIEENEIGDFVVRKNGFIVGPTRTSREEAEEFIRRQTKDSGLNQPTIEITPEMERNILAGQRLFSRKATQSPIEDAIKLAQEKHADLKIDGEEEFFKHWSKLLRKVGNQLNPTPYGLRVAAQRAVNDMQEWIKNNSRYADYYDKDMVAVRDALKEKYGKVSDDDMRAFQLFAGLTSPNTGLKSNIGDALALLDLLKTDGSLDQIKLGLSDNNNVVIERSPFQISGNTNGNKARSAKVFDRLIREKGSVSKAVDFLMEPVTDKELKAFNKEMGYKSDPEMGKVKRLVKSATGQEEKIPRMFIFGPKVGAYTMNLTGDRKYTTIDIWESRFIRSYFNNLFKEETGLPVDDFEHDLFTRFGDYFKEEFDKLTGKDWDPASLQAMRWFYIINATNKAGYTGASTNDTISEYTRQQLYTAGKSGEYRRGQGNEKARSGTRKYSRQDQPAEGQPSAAAGESGLRERGGVRGGEGLLRDAYRPYQEAGRAGKSLAGLLKRVKVDGRIVEFESFAPAQRLAEEYMKEAGMPYNPPTTYVRVDPTRSTKIADEFGRMKHNPQDPLVQAAYRQMMKETSDQYRKILESGLKVEFIKGDDPYGNPRNAILDVIENNHFWVFPTVDGFGSSELDVSNNPLLEETEFKDANGETMLANDVFRVVHDYFGHIMHGVGFRADGEENAWRAHASMYSPLARRAMTTETRGQNSYVNYGPNGEFNRSASPSETIYADQKVGLLPEWVSTDTYEGVLEEAVQKAQKDTEETGKFAVPLYGADATPEALYVAQNPEMGKKPSEDDIRRYSRRNAPDVSPAAKAIMDRATPLPPDETFGQSILKKMEFPPLADMKDRFRQGAIFRYARLERQYRQNPELMAQLADTSAIAAIELADHARAFTQRAILYGVPVYENGTTKIKDFVHNGKQYRGLLEVMGMLYSPEHGNLEQLAHAYATAVRGERLNKEGKLSPVAPGELAVLEKEVNRFVNPETGQPIIKEWFDTWQAYNSNIVKYLRDTGIVDQAGADLWMKQADYIPFYREDAEGNLQFPRVFGGLHTAGQFKAVGKSDKALNVDMITAIVGNVDAAIAMGMKNIAQQRIIRDQIKLGLASVLKQGETVGQRNSVSFKVAGKRYTAIIDDPLIYESMLPVSEIPLDGIIGQVVRAPAGLLREMIIRDPGYMIANMFRDTLSSYAITGAEITPVVDTVRGMFSDLTNLENMGVVGGYDLRLDDGGVRKFYDKHAKKMGMVAGLDWTKPWMAVWDGMGRLSTRSEAATRLAVYNDVLARTGNEAEAQYQALSVMNYGRRGSNPLLRALTAVVPFMNARIQGLDKLYQAGRGRIGAKYDTSATGEKTRNLNNLKNFQRFFFRAALITGVTALYYAMVSDDDEYKNASPEVRDGYYIIPLKKGDVAAGEPGLSMRLPIPFEVGILFKVVPERLLATMYGEDTPRDVKQSFWRNMTSTLAINPIPQAVLPAVEMMFNYDTFTGRPVVPAYMENLLPEQQQTFYTNQLAVKLAETETGQKLGISPMKLEHLLNGYFGTLGGYFLQALDSVARENEMVKPDTTWYQKPFIKRFFTTANQPGLQNQFYDLKDYTDGITRTINDLQEQGRYDELAAFYAKNGHLYEMRSTLNFLNREITALRDQRKMIEQMDIDPESKRELIEQINMQIAATLTSVPMLRQEAFGPRKEE